MIRFPGVRCDRGAGRRLAERKKQGETISEVLAAALVIALATTMLASMVMASFRLVKNSGEAYDTFRKLKNQYETLTSESGSPASLSVRYVSGVDSAEGEPVMDPDFTRWESKSIGIQLISAGGEKTEEEAGEDEEKLYGYRANEAIGTEN